MKKNIWKGIISTLFIGLVFFLLFFSTIESVLATQYETIKKNRDFEANDAQLHDKFFQVGTTYWKVEKGSTATNYDSNYYRSPSRSLKLSSNSIIYQEIDSDIRNFAYGKYFIFQYFAKGTAGKVAKAEIWGEYYNEPIYFFKPGLPQPPLFQWRKLSSDSVTFRTQDGNKWTLITTRAYIPNTPSSLVGLRVKIIGDNSMYVDDAGISVNCLSTGSFSTGGTFHGEGSGAMVVNMYEHERNSDGTNIAKFAISANAYTTGYKRTIREISIKVEMLPIKVKGFWQSDYYTLQNGELEIESANEANSEEYDLSNNMDDVVKPMMATVLKFGLGKVTGIGIGLATANPIVGGVAGAAMGWISDATVDYLVFGSNTDVSEADSSQDNDFFYVKNSWGYSSNNIRQYFSWSTCGFEFEWEYDRDQTYSDSSDKTGLRITTTIQWGYLQTIYGNYPYTDTWVFKTDKTTTLVQEWLVS